MHEPAARLADAEIEAIAPRRYCPVESFFVASLFIMLSFFIIVSFLFIELSFFIPSVFISSFFIMVSSACAALATGAVKDRARTVQARVLAKVMVEIRYGDDEQANLPSKA